MVAQYRSSSLSKSRPPTEGEKRNKQVARPARMPCRTPLLPCSLSRGSQLLFSARDTTNTTRRIVWHSRAAPLHAQTGRPPRRRGPADVHTSCAPARGRCLWLWTREIAAGGRPETKARGARESLLVCGNCGVAPDFPVSPRVALLLLFVEVFGFCCLPG